jgi:hypothetical protein
MLLVVIATVVLLESADDCCGEMYNAAVLLDRSSIEEHVRDPDENIFLVIAVGLGTDLVLCFFIPSMEKGTRFNRGKYLTTTFKV